MREFGIIYFTGDVLRVAVEQRRDEDPTDKWSRLPLNIVQMANYVVDLTTNKELKSRYVNPDDYDVVNKFTREMFMDTPLSSVAEAIVQMESWQRRARLAHMIREKLSEESKRHVEKCVDLVHELDALWERDLTKND